MNTKKKRYKKSKSEWLCIILLCAPAVIHLLIFWLGVQLETIRMAFTDYFTGEVGLSNFYWVVDQFTGGSVTDLAEAMRNTLIFFAKGMLLVPITMFFSYLCFRKVFAHGFIRLALYLPGAVSGIMMALFYIKIMESSGPLMHLIQEVTKSDTPIMLMIENGMAYVLIFDILLGVGGNIILWLGGMSRIPVDLIEYGKLEGIGPFREFATVVLPLIWPTFVTMMSLQIIGIFGSDGSVLVLTNGLFGTNTLAFWMYSMVQKGLADQYNYVSALGLMLTILTIPILIIFRKVINKFGGEVEY